jgi:membrane peptidoglycan carboxypeptidase
VVVPPGGAAIRSAPSLSLLHDMAGATTVLDARGRPLFSIFEEQRREVPLSAISPQLLLAILAIEDHRFSSHAGIDVIRMIGCCARCTRSGSSTRPRSPGRVPCRCGWPTHLAARPGWGRTRVS